MAGLIWVFGRTEQVGASKRTSVKWEARILGKVVRATSRKARLKRLLGDGLARQGGRMGNEQNSERHPGPQDWTGRRWMTIETPTGRSSGEIFRS